MIIEDYEPDSDERCERCDSQKDLRLVIHYWATRIDPQDDELVCLKCIRKDKELKLEYKNSK